MDTKKLFRISTGCRTRLTTERFRRIPLDEDCRVTTTSQRKAISLILLTSRRPPRVGNRMVIISWYVTEMWLEDLLYFLKVKIIRKCKIDQNKKKFTIPYGVISRIKACMVLFWLRDFSFTCDWSDNFEFSKWKIWNNKYYSFSKFEKLKFMFKRRKIKKEKSLSGGVSQRVSKVPTSAARKVSFNGYPRRRRQRIRGTVDR